jgi:hypothetical protein
LINLLFQVKDDDFNNDIRSKPYSKYQYQLNLKGPKTEEKEAFLKAINRLSINHL